jgi:hypothetical protein
MASLRSIFGASGAFSLACALLITANQAGCQPAVRNFAGSSSSGTGGTTGHGGGPSTSASTGSGGGASTTGTGGSGGTAPVCTTSLPPYAGPLCGSATVPCTVHIDEILPNAAAGRDDAPGIAFDSSCSPRIAFSASGTPDQGFYASRGALVADGGADAGGGGADGGGDGGTPYLGPWTVESTPFNADTIGVVIPTGGSAQAVAYDGANAVTLWSLAGSTWSQVEQVPGMLQFWSNGLGVDDQGDLHATFVSSTGFLNYGVYANGWANTALMATPSGSSPLAVSPTGVAQFSYWTSGGTDGGVAGLAWATATSPNMPEIAWQAAVGNTSHAITVTPPDGANPDGVPHLLFARAVAGSTTGAQEVVYATRTTAGEWTATSLDQESATNVQCGAPGLGKMCTYSYDQIQPLAAVSSRSGDVRFVYEKYRYQGTKMSICEIFGGTVTCHWVDTSNTSTGQLFVASVAAATGVTTAAVVSDIMAKSGTAIVDPLGRIHLAVYDSYPPSQAGTTVRYLQLGP